MIPYRFSLGQEAKHVQRISVALTRYGLRAIRELRHVELASKEIARNVATDVVAEIRNENPLASGPQSCRREDNECFAASERFAIVAVLRTIVPRSRGVPNARKDSVAACLGVFTTPGSRPAVLSQVATAESGCTGPRTSSGTIPELAAKLLFSLLVRFFSAAFSGRRDRFAHDRSSRMEDRWREMNLPVFCRSSLRKWRCPAAFAGVSASPMPSILP